MAVTPRISSANSIRTTRQTRYKCNTQRSSPERTRLEKLNTSTTGYSNRGRIAEESNPEPV